MAIIKKIPEISVSIAIEGKEADEYDARHEKEQAQHEVPMVCRYVEARSGSEYSISYRISPDFQFKPGTDILVLVIHVDGSHFHSEPIRKSALGGSDYCGQVPSPHTKSPEQVSALVFSEVQPIENASLNTIKKDMRRVSAWERFGFARKLSRIRNGVVFLHQAPHAFHRRRYAEAPAA
ncbi:hypothetical protein Forpe1208_v016318 [Fusarium oxysporum f. sp. rapae]|uniref:DUF7918 domain-containing protein n=1 Tax=Fusarium oxysporum f. sp. rapae TaxID=485398 RepID=A0A8J5TMW5_FUSOX|nr:hypothetical protein Forpe1208_v016318 [Fusarium oxysporum f. sp. rapae]